LVDRLVWFQAPLLIGGDGLPAVGPLGAAALAECLSLARSHGLTLARDAVQAYIVNTD
jgi:diaminohydroxyphosphoribosylaminopyrimidine deaminase/5-amino-6-(5-phosphoribosylamino)uracil reductase